MDLKLTILAGAKQGTSIPLKKDKFLIGRASECTLCAGSNAISRKHCAILRKKSAWTVRDLGSRNGTYLNDQRIEEETPLSVGDELRVGPLIFLIEQRTKHQPSDETSAKKASSKAAAGDPQKGRPSKRPPVRNVAQIAKRTADLAGQLASEDDISRWLIDGDDPKSQPMGETQAVNTDETKSIPLDDDSVSSPQQPKAPTSADELAAETEDAKPSEEETPKESSWNWFKKGKGKKDSSKKKPGKLPAVQDQDNSKDSRDAASEILREMTRRH